MSTTYNVQPGDTLESIARKQYGTESASKQIAEANPGLSEPLTAGVQIITPSAPGDLPEVIPQISADNENEVAVIIEGSVFRFWEQITITRSIDAMDVINFSAPFDPEAEGFRDTFRPFTFKPMQITVGGEPLFTGTLITVNPKIENRRKTLMVGGYSLPGVLNDCTPPASSFPLEFNNQSLREIAAVMTAPFGIAVDFRAGQEDSFLRVACDPNKRVYAFLVELAKQRNLIVSSSSNGELIFWQSVEAGNPVAILIQGDKPVLSITPFFSPQEYYSHITGIEPVVVGSEGSQFTVKNERLKGVLRPINFNANDIEGAAIKEVVEAKSGRMFGNMASYTIKVSTWRDSSGNLWTPNTTVKVRAPGAMIYNDYEFIIRAVIFNRERASETATLNLVIPGSFSGQNPEVLPWEE